MARFELVFEDKEGGGLNVGFKGQDLIPYNEVSEDASATQNMAILLNIFIRNTIGDGHYLKGFKEVWDALFPDKTLVDGKLVDKEYNHADSNPC